MNDPIKVWVSKYAVTIGHIRQIEAWDDGDGFVVERGRYHNRFKLGHDAHLTRAAAVDAAKKARVKKIASLKAQIAKLEKLSFDEVAP